MDMDAFRPVTGGSTYILYSGWLLEVSGGNGWF